MAQTSTRRGAIGYHLPVSTAPVWRLGEGIRKDSESWRRQGERKEKGGEDICLYIMHGNGGGCPGALGPNRCEGL